MTYYEWWGDLDSIEIRFPVDEFNGFWMVEGSEVIGWDDEVYMIAVYHCPNPPVFGFGLADNSWPVFSPDMQTLLQKIAPGVIQFLPFRFQRPDGSGQIVGYCVGQILRLVDCLDRRRTRVKNDWVPINERGDFDTRGPAVLSRSLIGDETLFRIKGDCGTIVIREDLKKVIENAGFKEQRFDLLECAFDDSSPELG